MASAFKPSASTGAARELSTKALDVVFWPFSEYAHDDEAPPCRITKILEPRSTRFFAALFLLLGVFAVLAVPPAPLSLLRYFKPSASTGAARELSTKALDVVFWPRLDALIVVSVLRERPEDDVEGFGRELASGAGGRGGAEAIRKKKAGESGVGQSLRKSIFDVVSAHEPANCAEPDGLGLPTPDELAEDFPPARIENGLLTRP
jgi:hypothetical protein